MLAFTASDAIIAVVLAAAGALFAWSVGHEVEKDVSAIGTGASSIIEAAANPLIVIGVLVAMWLFLRHRKG